MSKHRRDSKHRREFIEKLKNDPSFYPSYRASLPDLLLSNFAPEVQTAEIQGIITEGIEGFEALDTYQDLIDKRRAETGSRKKLELLTVYLRAKEIDTQKLSKRLDPIIHAETAKGSHYVNPSELANLIETTLTPPKKKTAISGHLLDQTLLTYDQRHQPTLFNNDPSQVKSSTDPNQENTNSIEYIGSEDIGVRLSSAEHQIVSILQDIYQERIETNKQLPEGDKQTVTVTDITHSTTGRVNKHQLPTARIAFSLYDITHRLYTDGTAGGKAYKKVHSILDKLEQKRFRIEYISTVQSNRKDGKPNRWHVSTRDPLIKRYDMYPIDVRTELGEKISTYQIVYELQSIFIHQIEDKRIYRDRDIAPKLREANNKAHGTGKVTNEVWQLYYELLRAVTSNTTRKDENGYKIYTIAEARLLDKVAPKLWEAKRKTYARNQLDKAIKTLQKYGLVVEAKRKGTQYVFTLNPDG